MAKKKLAATKRAWRKRATKRELADTGTDKRFVRRGGRRFKESGDVGKSFSIDRREIGYPSGRRRRQYSALSALSVGQCADAAP